MSNSTSLLDTISSSQSSKEVTANAMFDAASTSMLFGRRASTTSALTWGFYGGTMSVDGVLTQISNGSVSLTNNATNYIEATRAGSVSVNTSGFSAGRTPLYSVVTSGGAVTSYTDYRFSNWKYEGRLSLSVAGNTNVTLTQAQASCDILEFTGALTGNIQVIVPLVVDQWTVFNNTSGAFTLTVIGATGTGIAVGQGKRCILYADGTNVVRATADV